MTAKNDRLTIRQRKRRKSNWMKGFIIEGTANDELERSQQEARMQLADKKAQGKKHYITR